MKDDTDDATHHLEVEPASFEQIPHWLLFHEDVTPNAIRLYLVLRSFAMGKSLAFPSRKTLATAMNVTLPTLDAAKKNLVDVGAITVQGRSSPSGDQTSNMYTVLWEEKNFTGSKDSWATPPKNLSDPLLRNLDTKTYQEEADKPKQTIKEPRTRMRKPVNDDDPQFEQFWSMYPRKSAKGTARRAWSKAITKTDPQTIIAAASRYADDPNREPTFTAHAATWLNGERWDDDMLPARDSKGERKVSEVADMIRRAAERDAVREIEA